MESELTRMDIARLLIWLLLCFGLVIEFWDRQAWKDSIEAKYEAQVQYWKERYESNMGGLNAKEVWKDIDNFPQAGIQNKTG